MTLNHHAALRAIGATLNKLHTTETNEYWNIPVSAESEFYDMRATIPFRTLLCGFREAGFIVFLDKPEVPASDHVAHLLAALQSIIEWTEDNHAKPDSPSARLEFYARRELMIRNAARAAIIKVTGSAA